MTIIIILGTVNRKKIHGGVNDPDSVVSLS